MNELNPNYEKSCIEYYYNLDNQSGPSFLERQDMWKEHLKSRSEARMQEIEEIQQDICTFKPNTNAKSLSSTQGVFERLYSTVKATYVKSEEEIEDMTECTFKPKINQSSIRSRIMESTKFYSKTISMPQEDYSFKPSVMEPSQTMKNAKAYLSQDPFERLYMRSPSKSYVKIKTNTRSQSNFSEFLKRQADHWEKSSANFQNSSKNFKDKKGEITSTTQYDCRDPNREPKICERSRKLTKKPFSIRYDEFQQRVKQNTQEILDLEMKKHTFKPKITSKAKNLHRRSCHELSYQDANKTKDKINQLRFELEEQEQELMKARVYSRQRGTSKLQVFDDPDNYVKKLKIKQEAKIVWAQIEIQKRLEKETQECTHKPVINKKR